MEKSIFVRVGLAMEAVDTTSIDAFKLEAILEGLRNI